MTVIVKQCTVEGFIKEPNFMELLDRYADELALEGLPHPRAKLDMYRKLETLGLIHFFGAYLDGFLVGIINVLMTEHPHYGVSIASTESYFVLKEHRKTGAGTLLRRQAEMDAKKSDSLGIFISAPFGSTLSSVLEASKDYIETGRTFFKRLGA